MRGDTDYTLDAFTSTENQDIPPGVIAFIYQAPENLVMTEANYISHRRQTDPWKELAPENTGKPKKGEKTSKKD